MVSHHTVSVELENKPGALVRVSQMFARRGYNIQSLAVGPTERPDISRLTLRVDCSEHSLEQIEKQIHKLVNVLRVVELRPEESVERELALITVAAPADKRAELIALGDVFGARVADIGREAITFEIVGRPEELDAFEELVRPHGVRELARTGRIGLRRPGSRQARRTAPSPRKGNQVKEVIKSGDASLLTGKVAVIGYGSQGHAHALNLADSGVEVVVGLKPTSTSRRNAEDAGLPVRDVADAVKGAQVVALLVPDGPQAALFRDEVAPEPRSRDGRPLRPRLLGPLRPHRLPRQRRRDHGRAEGPGPHRAAHVRGGLRHARR